MRDTWASWGPQLEAMNVGRWPGPRVQRPRGPVCSECGAGVFRHLLVDADRAARVVISAAPDRYGLGRVAAYQDVAGGWHARLLEHGQAPRWGERRYRPHIEECRGQRTA